MANPYLVLGGIAVGAIVAGFGIVQVPGWIEKAQDAAALSTIADMADAQAAISAVEGHYVDTMAKLRENPNVQLTPADGVDITHLGTDPEGTLWCGVVESLTGRYFAGSDKDRSSGPYDTPADAAAGANCDPTTIVGLPDPGGNGQPGGGSGQRMQIVVDTTNESWCSAININLRTVAGEPTPNVTVDWGDGTAAEVHDTGWWAYLNHAYSAPGTYTITIDGTFPWLQFNDGSLGSSAPCVDRVPLWEETGTVNARYTFYDARFLTELDSPPATITNMEQMLYNAHRFNDDVSDWDVSNVTNMQQLFAVHSMTGHKGTFNQALSSWDVSSVINMNTMFLNQASFNQPLDGWKTLSLENARSMFSGATSFNQPLGNWEMSKVKDVSMMFLSASAFDQDLSGWSLLPGADHSWFSDGSPMREDFMPTWR